MYFDGRRCLPSVPLLCPRAVGLRVYESYREEVDELPEDISETVFFSFAVQGKGTPQDISVFFFFFFPNHSLVRSARSKAPPLFVLLELFLFPRCRATWDIATFVVFSSGTVSWLLCPLPTMKT